MTNFILLVLIIDISSVYLKWAMVHSNNYDYSTFSGKDEKEHASEAPELVFIIQNKPVKFSKQTSTQIRKHVMKDIGKSRRKERQNRQISLELPDTIGDSNTGSESRLPVRISSDKTGTFQQFEHRETGSALNDIGGASSSTPFFPRGSAPFSQPAGVQHGVPEYTMQPYQGKPRDTRSSVQYFPTMERLGSGRGDPLARYPVPMKGQMRELLDEGTLFPPFDFTK